MTPTAQASATPTRREVTLDDYYADAAVRARILEYCGGSATARPTAAYLSVLTGDPSPPMWERAPRVPLSGIESIWSSRGDIARSLWDEAHLLFVLEIDYENVDFPAEPFLHPADVFVKLDAAYRAASEVLADFRLPVQIGMTGRGYHFSGQIPLGHSVIDALGAIVPRPPHWFSGVTARRPAGIATPMSERHGRAATGLGCLIEYVAHLIRARAVRSAIPVVFNGTVVGNRGGVGRECVSIDFSHVGDPLDVRHMRVAFGTYQWHHLRPDIFGQTTARLAPVVAVLPAGRESVAALLTRGRGLESAMKIAPHVRVTIPDATQGVRRLLSSYRRSPLARFHRTFYADLDETSERRPQVADVGSMPPCVSAALVQPNDLLLKPEHLQHLVRWLMSRRWRPASIARLVQAAYESDHGWGDRWIARMDAQTRAEFEVRVFAGLVATGADALVDFNCVSAQEKDVCPRTGCLYDLRIDRDRLTAGLS